MRNIFLKIGILVGIVSVSLMGITQIKVPQQNSHYKPFSLSNGNSSSVKISFNVPNLIVDSLSFDNEKYTTIQAQGFGKSYKANYPDLPSLSKLIQVPSNVNLTINDIAFSVTDLDIDSLGFLYKVKPATQSLSKSDERQNVNPVKGQVYNVDNFINTELVQLHEIGIMRNVKLYELVYSPILYNPVKNKLKIRNNVSAQISWNNTAFNSTNWVFEVDAKSDFLFTDETENKGYVIVSPLKYKNTLARFIKWKKQKGYNVIEAYVGEQILTNNKNDIKAYLNSLYESDDFKDKLHYLLIVGDVHDIPTYNGNTASHVTDLYYADFTNDYLPELYYGRISVLNSTELENVIDKTLFVEKGQAVSYEYQNKHLLVSGVDSEFAPLYGNGALSYLLDYYSNMSLGIEPSYYLYGSGSPILSNNSLARQYIMYDYSDGVGIAYYTAHCDVNGWVDPKFVTSDIDNLTNKNKYPLMIGNCCESLKFNQNSFGEEIVRKKDKGAVAYIGATNYSYWDEDYHWGVGLTANISANPTYEQSGIGAFDAWFHTHNENHKDRAYTISEILNVGNLAVQSSTSALKEYYWEVYQIMGDPSLVPAKYKYNRITADYSKAIRINQSLFVVETEPNACVSLTYGNEVLGSAFADGTGYCSLPFKAMTTVHEKAVELVISKPDFLPLIDSLDTFVPEGAFLTFTNALISDSLYGNNNKQTDFGEKISLSLVVENFGTVASYNAQLVIETKSEWVVGQKEFSADLNTVNAGEQLGVEIENHIEIADFVPNNSEILFSGYVINNARDSNKIEFSITVHAPNFEVLNWVVNDSLFGNGNGIIEENEQAQLQLVFINNGNAQISNTTIIFESLNTDLLQIENDGKNPFLSEVSKTYTNTVNFNAGTQIFPGELVNIKCQIQAGKNKQYTFNDETSISLGSKPSYNMADTVIELVSAYFYDSGGEQGNYSNNENYTLTFTPHYSHQGLMVNFHDFEIEAARVDCFDQLQIYDGASANAQLLGTYCSNNVNESIQSQNPDGALTFKFTSDNDVIKSGWKALISAVNKYTVTFVITDGVDNINDFEIEFGNQSKIVQKNGTLSFNNVLASGAKNYIVKKEGFLDGAGVINNINSDTTIKILVQRLPNICMSVFSQTEPIAGASVFIGSQMQQTDEQGNANFNNLTPGTKPFTVKADGFKDSVGSINVTDIDVCYNINLVKKEKHNLAFLIKSNNTLIEGAELIINESSYYSNNIGEVIISDLYSGAYPYSINKTGYFIHADTILLNESDNFKEVELIPDFNSVNLANYSFEIYPNPLGGSKELKVKSTKNISELKIFNYDGKLLVTKIAMPKEFSINLSDFTGGIYILQLKISDNYSFKKLMVK